MVVDSPCNPACVRLLCLGQMENGLPHRWVKQAGWLPRCRRWVLVDVASPPAHRSGCEPAMVRRALLIVL